MRLWKHNEIFKFSSECDRVTRNHSTMLRLYQTLKYLNIVKQSVYCSYVYEKRRNNCQAKVISKQHNTKPNFFRWISSCSELPIALVYYSSDWIEFVLQLKLYCAHCVLSISINIPVCMFVYSNCAPLSVFISGLEAWGIKYRNITVGFLETYWASACLNTHYSLIAYLHLEILHQICFVFELSNETIN